MCSLRMKLTPFIFNDCNCVVAHLKGYCFGPIPTLVFPHIETAHFVMHRDYIALCAKDYVIECILYRGCPWFCGTSLQAFHCRRVVPEPLSEKMKLSVGTLVPQSQRRRDEALEVTSVIVALAI